MSAFHIVRTPPPPPPPPISAAGGGRVEPPIKFLKSEGLAAPQLLEGVAGKEGDRRLSCRC